MKYWYLLNSYIQAQLTFRSEQWLWFLLDSLPFFIVLFIWSSIYAQTGDITGFTLADMVFYYLLAVLLSMMTSSHFEEWRVEEIREGKVDKYFIQPVGYIQHVLAGFSSGKIVFSTINLPVFILFACICTRLFHVTLPTVSSTAVLPLLILTLFSFLFNFCLALLIVLFGFWLENADSLEHFKWLLVSLLSGQLLPITLMPEKLQQLACALPFKYLVSVPAMVALNKYSLTRTDYASMMGTLIIFGICLLLVWQKAKYKYSSAGG